MSQLEIKILHQDYLLSCPDGQETQLLEAVERVDQQLQVMRDNGKLRSRERIGVLLAVNLAYESLELRQQLQALQKQLAALQGTANTEQTDADTERLTALEAQAVHDQALAHHIVARLDQALAAQEATSSDTVEVTATEAALDNTEHMDLASAPAESL